MNDINEVLKRLSKSKFRNSFYLKDKDKKYIEEKGMNKIEEHAFDFIEKRLSGKIIPNDGRQTPLKGHPVFIAQHATATCCRGCLYKWHRIEQKKQLSDEEIRYIVKVIILWIEKNLKN